MLTADEALDRLKKGNARFASDEVNPAKFLTHQQRTEMVKDQHPFAIILGCSDSRVPAEMVFDQGFGDLFVIRLAGNVIDTDHWRHFYLLLGIVWGCGALEWRHRRMLRRGPSPA